MWAKSIKTRGKPKTVAIAVWALLVFLHCDFVIKQPTVLLPAAVLSARRIRWNWWCSGGLLGL